MLLRLNTITNLFDVPFTLSTYSKYLFLFIIKRNIQFFNINNIVLTCKTNEICCLDVHVFKVYFNPIYLKFAFDRFLNNNQIVKLDRRAFEPLIQLAELKANKNRIGQLPTGLFTKLKKLKKL